MVKVTFQNSLAVDKVLFASKRLKDYNENYRRVFINSCGKLTRNVVNRKRSNRLFSTKTGYNFTKTDLVDSCKDGIGDLLLCVDWDLEYQMVDQN